MAFTREEILEKVRKCLALAAGTVPGEAEAAMLQAQKLMAKYHIAMAEVAETSGTYKEEAVVELRVDGINLARPWVRKLARIVAKNFRCCNYLLHWRTTIRAVMVGYETDAEAAKEVFIAAYKYAERAGENAAQRCNDKGFSSQGVKVNFCTGFVDGLEQAYSDQIAQEQSYALMVVVPEKAQDVINGITKEFEGGFQQHARRDSNYREGYSEGYDYGSRKQITD